MNPKYYLTVRLTATVLVTGQRFLLGPIGWAGGICDGVVLYAIWRTK